MMAVSIIGAAVAAYGAYQQGQAANSAATFNAQVQQQNAEVAHSNARSQARQQDRMTLLRLGAIRSAAGASGGSTGEGSVLDVLGDVASQSELERQQIFYRGEQAARGHTNTAALDVMQARASSESGTLRAGSELLRGGRSAGYDYELNRT